jgi:hypothetical protein
MINTKNRLLIFLRNFTVLATSVFFFVGCASSPKDKELVSGNIILKYKSARSLQPDVKKIQLAHPSNIDLSRVEQIMKSLRYLELTAFGKERNVFLRKDFKELSRLITKALSKARPDQIVFFEVNSSRGVTEGETFIEGPFIHWRFQKIRGHKFNETFSRSKQIPVGQGSSWKLLPKENQTYFSQERFVANVVYENWIVMGLSSKIRKQAN